MTPIIAIDFDGTIVTHEYPKIGKDVPHAIHYMKLFQNLGARLFLWTMRSGEPLNEAIQYLRNNGVLIECINVNHEQLSWTTSPKLYAHLYIDDAAVGCPLIFQNSGKPYVNWEEVGPIVITYIKSL